MRSKKRLLLLRQVAEFSGPPREQLALREAVRLYEISINDDPASEAERQVHLSHLSVYYGTYSVEFRAIYRAIAECFADELRAKADELRQMIEKLDADSVELLTYQNGQDE